MLLVMYFAKAQERKNPAHGLYPRVGFINITF